MQSRASTCEAVSWLINIDGHSQNNAYSNGVVDGGGGNEKDDAQESNDGELHFG